MVHLFFRWWRNFEEFFHRAVVSKGASDDAHSQFGEDRVKEERPRLQALMNSLLGLISRRQPSAKAIAWREISQGLGEGSLSFVGRPGGVLCIPRKLGSELCLPIFISKYGEDDVLRAHGKTSDHNISAHRSRAATELTYPVIKASTGACASTRLSQFAHPRREEGVVQDLGPCRHSDARLRV